MNPLEWPPCGNKRANGYCSQCSYCLRRLFGPEWWLRPSQIAHAATVGEAKPSLLRLPRGKR